LAHISSTPGRRILRCPLPALVSRGVVCALRDDDGSGILRGKEQEAWSQATNIFQRGLQAWESVDQAGRGWLAEKGVCWAACEDQHAEMW
jgi:hypothetical protein